VRRIWLSLVLILVGAGLFANSLGSPFVFDDLASIPQNASILRLWPPSVPLSPPHRGEAVAGRPIVNLSLAINHAIGGLNVTGYHVVNLALHLSCALLLFAIVRLTIADDFIAFACALIWMIHPLQTEVVDYTVARTESMMALCLLATLYCSIRGWTAAAVACCAVGMACKETMVVAPVLVVLWDVCDGRGTGGDAPRPPRKGLRARWPLYGGLAGTWLVLLALLATAPRAHSAGLFLTANEAVHPADAWTYLLNQAVLITRYLRLVLWPSGLVLDYGFPKALTTDQVLPQLLMLAALAIATVIALARWPRIGYLGAWFFLTLGPSSSFVPIATEVGAERRMYLPSMAIVVLAVALGRRWWHRHERTALVVLGSVAILLSGATILRNREYHSPLILWTTNVARWPGGRAHSNLAAALQAAGRSDEVVPQLRAAIDDFPEARYSLGTQLIAQGQLDEGVQQLNAFLREFPTHPNASPARDAVARAHSQMAAQLTNFAIGRASASRLDEAIPAFRRVVELMPQSAGAHRNLANALLAGGDTAGATAEARTALTLDPKDDVAKEILVLASKSHD
jgi:Flp pilus assembly protein TadD